MQTQKIVTRFAPSPTGYLHIGGARTALFNWAFARQHGGTFILRLEDTDRVRSTNQSTQTILQDLAWLGLDWDEGPQLGADTTGKTPDPHATQKGQRGPYFQSQRLAIYRRHIDQLLDCQRAYKCFKTPHELAQDREAAKREKRPYKYDPTESLGLSPQQIQRYEQEGKPCVVRFRMPDHDVSVDDLVLGSVTVKAAELEDFIILKSDGFPTFHLANVVDDALMGVTHVLRAQEHLMNTPKHVALQEALGFDPPSYAHMPLIFNADGSKMSKRDKAKVARRAAKQWIQEAHHQATPSEGDDAEEALDALAKRAGVEARVLAAFLDKKSDDNHVAQALAHPAALGLTLPEIDVHDFRASGYLPGVILNYIALLGWSPGNDIERFDMEFLVRQFNLNRIGKSNARFDRDKLLAFNTEAIAKLPPDEFYAKLKGHDAQFHQGCYHRDLGEPRFRLFAEAYRERSRTLNEPFVNGRFFVDEIKPMDYDQKAVAKVLLKSNGGGLAVLRDLLPILEPCAAAGWTAQALESLIKDYAQTHNLGLGKVAQPLRVAVAGSTVSPPIFDTLVILGPESTLAAIRRCLNALTGVTAAL